MPRSIFKLLCILFISTNSYAFLEIGGDFSYDRNIFGAERQSKSTSRTWGGTISAHIFHYTAVELNFYQTEDNTIVNETVTYGDLGISVLGQQTHVRSQNFGVGLRQDFASRKSFIQPSLSLGYARMFRDATTNYTIRNDLDGSTETSIQPTTKTVDDSMFGTFSLKLRLHKRFHLRGSVRTYIRAMDWNGAKDDLKYTVGFTCII